MNKKDITRTYKKFIDQRILDIDVDEFHSLVKLIFKKDIENFDNNQILWIISDRLLTLYNQYLFILERFADLEQNPTKFFSRYDIRGFQQLELSKKYIFQSIDHPKAWMPTYYVVKPSEDVGSGNLEKGRYLMGSSEGEREFSEHGTISNFATSESGYSVIKRQEVVLELLRLRERALALCRYQLEELRIAEHLKDVKK